MPEFLKLVKSWSIVCSVSLIDIASSTESFTQSLGDVSAFFANFSFLLLFLAMTVYWISLAFTKSTQLSYSASSPAQQLVTQSSLGSTSEIYPNKREFNLGLSNTTLPARGTVFNPNLGNIVIVGANICLFSLLALRWKDSGHFPLSNLYESLMFLSWTCTSIHIFLIRWGRSVASTTNLDKLLGSVLAPAALFLNAFATFSLPKEMQQAGPLVPALQSNWLMMHVTVMIISYAALMLGSLLSIAFLIYNKVVNSKKSVSSENSQNSDESSNTKTRNSFGNVNPNSKGALGAQANLDYLSYRIIGIGFPFLTIGILSGAVWANEAWGSYWSWDPKETWALLTWLVFAIYLHSRITKGWEGEKPALLASFGFLVVWMCYLGVNLLGEGLHSYGFFN